MGLSFGARLRAQRERQQVTLAAIAEQSKIRQPLLEALERDDVSQWPGGIFGRSYLRAYAQAIGLDPEATLREFLELHPEPADDIAPVAAVAAVSAGESPRRPRTRLHFLIESAVGALPQALFQPESKAAVSRSADVPVIAPPPADALVPDEAPQPDATNVEGANDRPLSDGPGTDGPRGDGSLSDDSLTDGPRMERRWTERRSSGRRSDDILSAHTQLGDPAPLRMNLTAMAALCTRLAQAQAARDIEAALAEAAEIFNAVGVILWMWDARNALLRPSLAHGYAREVLGRLPSVRADADNAIAAAFRSGETRVVAASGTATGAVVVPLMTPGGSAGALALELRDGGEAHESVRALATILAAQLSLFVEPPPLAQSATA